MSDQPVTLDFLAEQQCDILAEIRLIRDVMAATAAILTRIEARLSNRVQVLEEKAP